MDDTSSFLMALSRFVSVQGWPEKIYSDPGSQLWVQKRDSNKLGQKSTEMLCRGRPRRMVRLGYLVLQTALGTKEQVSR